MFPSNWLIFQCCKLLFWLSGEKMYKSYDNDVTATVLSDPSQSGILLGLCGRCENDVQLIWLATLTLIIVHENDNWEISY